VDLQLETLIPIDKHTGIAVLDHVQEILNENPEQIYLFLKLGWKISNQALAWLQKNLEQIHLGKKFMRYLPFDSKFIKS